MTAQHILIFHGIGSPRADLPADEHPYWISRDFFEEVVAFVAERADDRRILMTFDDGNASDLYAAEQLRRRDLHGKFFLLTGRFGQSHYVSRGEARDLTRDGFEVGLHGHDHVDWRRASDAQLDSELITARSELAAAIGMPVTSVALPFGAYNRRVIRRLRGEKFARVYTSDEGPARADAYFQARTSVMVHHRIEDVERLIYDHSGPFVRLRRKVAPAVKRWR